MQLRWLEQTEEQVPAGDDWLSPLEARCLASLHVPKRRTDWRLGRWTAKCAVAACLDAPRSLAEIEIRPLPSGAPEVFHANSAAPFAISISHRSGVACCSLADRSVEVGCDLEWIEPHSRAFVADYFTPGEQRLVENTALAQQPLVLALLWSAKESALKALRVGLRADTRSVAVEIPAISGELLRHPDVWRPVIVRHSTSKYYGWWCFSSTFVRTVVAAPIQPPPKRVPFGATWIYSEIFRSNYLQCQQ
jgi:4'-phosphopantetheinyl transferase